MRCSNSSSQMNIISSLILADNQGFLGCDGDILQEHKCGEELILRRAQILFKTELFFFTTVSLFKKIRNKPEFLIQLMSHYNAWVICEVQKETHVLLSLFECIEQANKNSHKKRQQGSL